MKKLAITITAFIVLVVAAGYTALNLVPGFVVSTSQSIVALSAGLDRKSVDIDGYIVNYYEGGAGEAVVLLHGMADDKNSFAATSGELTEKYRVILPDLNGHGENARDPSRDYSIAGHVALLEKFVTKIGLEKFALGGNSMGGHISAAYTLENPGQITKLILVNAPGLKFDDHVVYGGFGDKMETRKDFFKMMERVVHTSPSIPGPIVDHMIAEINENFDFINGLAVAVKAGKDFDLKDRIAQIMVPTLILWGENDQVVKFNVAEAYDQLLSNSKLRIIKEAGHSPQLEKPLLIGQEISIFLDQ